MKKFLLDYRTEEACLQTKKGHQICHKINQVI
jgi:hypothetical protein